ncbi:hypothetical protein K1T71_000889 [Dendrolimus kikuchii]|uniref:Uncharacterized protein n=1 Tax=Dendrolimus kikuchii TaxID=765133 RepID=A0ACC1DG22_9NEOP|nr:hypothetical protein K1T71_000889 [Dendrolimus kikuchii]
MVPRPMSPYPRAPLIPQFYAGRSIFITGATGFMGKVLVERLLSTCPDIERLYLLMRQKKDVSPEKRLLQLKQSQLFQSHKVRERNFLVSIVFHSAATLKFDEALNIAVDQNVKSVIRLMDICDKLPNMEAFIHVSTAYSNAELNVVEERVYPPPMPLHQVLAVAESVPEELMSSIITKYISPKPNTYTFTKALAENAVVDHGNRGYPVAIFRPTIVVSALKNPFPGWIENLNGPSGIVVAAGKGILHVFSCKKTAVADMLPVDIAIDTLLAVAWETATDRPLEAKVYNCSTYQNSTTWGHFANFLRGNIRAHPLDKPFWYPYGSTVENRYALKALEILTQTLPLHIAEYITRLLGVKNRLSFITVSQRIQAMSDVLSFFSLREWKFKTDNVQKLHLRLTPEDSAIYNLDPHSIDWPEHIRNFVIGVRKYLLNEKDQDIEEAKRHHCKMFYVHYSVMTFVLVLLCRFAVQNPLIRNTVFGILRLLLSLFNAAYSRIMPVKLQ